MADNSRLNPIYKCELDKALFPISVSQVYYNTHGAGQQQDPKHRVIMREDTAEVLGIVSDQYQLYTHRQAYQLGQEVFEKCFHVHPELFKVDINHSGSSCHIDLYSEEVNISISKGHRDLFGNWMEPKFKDKYYPFIRITNSYNRKYTLRFSLGFYRSKCANGLLMGYDHLGDISIPHNLPFAEARSIALSKVKDFAQCVNGFERQLDAVRHIAIPRHLLEVVALDMLDMQYGKERLPKLLKMKDILKDISPIYVEEMGANAMAAMNIATDYIKHIEHTHNVSILQSRPMEWMMHKAGDTFNQKEYLRKQDAYYSNVYARIGGDTNGTVQP